MVYKLAQVYLKAAFNNRSIVGDQFKFHTADYVKNKIPPIMDSEARTIINSLDLELPAK